MATNGFLVNSADVQSYHDRHSYHDKHSSSAAGELDNYGFSGSPGNPLLVEGLITSRLSAGIANAKARRPIPNGLPGFEVDTASIDRWAAAPRSAMLQMELLNGIEFRAEVGTRSPKLVRVSGNETVELIRLGCPQWPQFDAQLQIVEYWREERPIRMAEILTQTTPPISYFASLLNMQSGRHRRTLEVIDSLLGLVFMIGMRFKHRFAVPRPSDVSLNIQPIIEVPGHGAFPMGHASESYAIAEVLLALLDDAGALDQKSLGAARTALHKLAFRISENRVVAGVHYPIDAVAGRRLGVVLAKYFLWRCRGRSSAAEGVLEAMDPNADDLSNWTFNDNDLAFHGDETLPMQEYAAKQVGQGESDLLSQLWNKAVQEWKI